MQNKKKIAIKRSRMKRQIILKNIEEYDEEQNNKNKVQ